MSHSLKLLVAVAGASVLFAAANGAMAESYRLPKAGNPALAAEAPAGWKGQYTGANEMMISSPDDMAILELEMIADPAMAAKSLDEIARDVLRHADLSPRWTDTQPESVAGIQGQAYIIPIARDGVPVGAAHLIVAKVDDKHVARLTAIILPKETPAEEQAALKALISRVTVSGR